MEANWPMVGARMTITADDRGMRIIRRIVAGTEPRAGWLSSLDARFGPVMEMVLSANGAGRLNAFRDAVNDWDDGPAIMTTLLKLPPDADPDEQTAEAIRRFRLYTPQEVIALPT